LTIVAPVHVVAERYRAASAVLEPLFSRKADMNVRRLGAGRSFVVGLVPRGVNPATITAPDHLRVPTRATGVFINYYEVWLPLSGSSDYQLERVYLHVYRRANREDVDQQLLSLHCDPALAVGSDSYIYKRGPHLHVGGAIPNIDRAHVSLCIGDDDLGGKDVDSLTYKFAVAVEMISDEFFPHYVGIAA